MSLLVLSRNSGSCLVGFSLITRKNRNNLCLQVWEEFTQNCTCSRLRISSCFILSLNCCVHCSSVFVLPRSLRVDLQMRTVRDFLEFCYESFQLIFLFFFFRSILFLVTSRDFSRREWLAHIFSPRFRLNLINFDGAEHFTRRLNGRDRTLTSFTEPIRGVKFRRDASENYQIDFCRRHQAGRPRESARWWICSSWWPRSKLRRGFTSTLLSQSGTGGVGPRGQRLSRGLALNEG